MADWLQTFVGLSPILLYLILFISAFVENVVPPIPGDTVVIFGAYLVGTGYLDYWMVYSSTTLGCFLGFMCIYGLSFRLGRRFIENGKWINGEKYLPKVEKWFDKYGYLVIVSNRFLSGARSVISAFAGLAKMSWINVSLLSFTSAAIWNGLLIYAGILVGKNWDKIVLLLKTYNRIIISAMIIWICIILFIRKRMKKTS